MKEAQNVVGLVIRYSDKLFSNVDTITEHNNIILKEGAVFFGKAGKFIGKKNLDMCNDTSLERRLIVVKKREREVFFL